MKVKTLLVMGALVGALGGLSGGARFVQPQVQANRQPAPVPDITPAEAADQQHYRQPLRPQFHYTPIQGHIGDATGLVYYAGEYHLFNIFDEWGRRSSDHKRWGHAISTDLLHWQQMPAILDTLVDHKPGSGSTVVDWNNSSGLQQTHEKTLVLFYTDYQKGSSIAFSNNKGRSWVRYAGNPVLDGFEDIRDPNVFWFNPTNDWRMIRYEKRGFEIYRSKDLIHWTHLSRIAGSFYECPDLFALPVTNFSGQTRWVLIDGDGSYLIGSFDGTKFEPETQKLKVEFGPSFYATQTWKNVTGSLSAIQMAWLKYPRQSNLTWDGQMSFPTRLSVLSTPGGMRLSRMPIDAIKTLEVERKNLTHLSVASGSTALKELPAGGLYDLHITIKPQDAQSFGVNVNGENIVYSRKDQILRVGEAAAPLTWTGNELRLRILVDRSSLEVFAQNGLVSISVVTLSPGATPVTLLSAGRTPTGFSIRASVLESIWKADRRRR